MNLYANNVPYKNTNWVLCGFVAEDSIFSLGDKLYMDITTTRCGLCQFLGLVIMSVVIAAARPVYGFLMDGIRSGIAGQKEFAFRYPGSR